MRRFLPILAVFALGCASSVQAPGFVSGPVRTVSSGVVTIEWETEVPTRGVVELGTTSGEYHLHAYRAGAGVQTEHRVDLIGLDPDAAYAWRVRGVSADRQVLASHEETLVAPTFAPERELLSLSLIDISRNSPGDALLMQTPGGTNVLFDGGGDDARYVVREFVQGRGVHGIDYAVVNHDHWDHAAGLARGLLEDLAVQAYVIPEYNMREMFIEEIRDIAGQLGSEEIRAVRGQRTGTASWLDWGAGVEARVVSSGAGHLLRTGHEGSDINNDSIVLHVRYGDATFLLTGDAERDVNNTFILDDTDALDVDVDVLKVNHHGRTDGTSYRFAAALSPQIALVSTHNHGLLHEDTIHVLNAVQADVFRSDLPSPNANRTQPDQEGGRSHVVIQTDGTTLLVEYDPK